jgi:uncharacterized protein
MGHRDSPAQLSRHGGFFAAGGGTAAPAPANSLVRGGAAEAHGVRSSAKSASAYALLFLVRCYMIFLSPFFGGACKFHPSCSNYAYEAIARHGARRGLVLAIKRLLRCRPFTVGGFDPVPEPEPPAAAFSDAAQGSREPVQ